MSAPSECPHLDLGPARGLRCFDPLSNEYVTPPKGWLSQWCLGDFRACPVFLGEDFALPGTLQMISQIEEEQLIGEIFGRGRRIIFS